MQTDDGDATVPLAHVEDVPQNQPVTPGEVAPAIETKPISKLMATGGILSGRTFTIGRNGLMIGRDPAACQVVVADDEISRLHAWVGYNEDGKVVLRDRNSANGTYVNKVRVKEKALLPSDEIAFGTGHRHVFRLLTAESTAPPGTPAISIEGAAPRPTPSGTGPSVLTPAEIAEVNLSEKTAAGTVKLKLTDLIARPHLELIVDKYAVKKIDIPDGGLSVGRDPSRCPLVLEHPSVSGE
ncbi:MAG: FHA domain-containing protein, partial [Deltaproteobacteria bacterium]